MQRSILYSPRIFLRLLISALLLPAFALCGSMARADDGIFPPAPAAKSSIDFDGRGFLINGKRTFIVSGSLHYSRVPRALWRDRLLRIKRAGFNTVQTYAFWNYHEPQEGHWNFSGDHDFEAFLKLIKELGLYAVVRPGPYVCAEWDSGGYPVWLRFKPGVRVREDNPQFIAANDAWYDHILPIIARNQIHRGGAVIMVQLENEHPQGWGREMPNGYFRHLQAKALALGIEVPYFFSGLHHGSDPAGDRPWDSKGRTNPWYSTEFWPGWYDQYGPHTPARFRFFDRGVWKILAYGGNGYNFYMLYGGTNFDFTNDDEVASNYDYGGAIGQAGDLRPIYYRFKRAAYFGRSFADLLEDSANATETFQNLAFNTKLRVTARTGPAGTAIFLDNNTDETILFRGMPIAPGEIAPLLQNYRLLPDVVLRSANMHTLGVARQGAITTLVVYGPNGLPADGGTFPPRIEFAVPETGVTVLKGEGISRDPADPKLLVISPTFPRQGANEYLFAVGDHKVRVLAVSDRMADFTWFVEAGGKEYVIGGPAYVGDVEEQNGKLHLIAERDVQDHRKEAQDGNTPADPGSFVYGPDTEAARLAPPPLALSGEEPPLLPVPTLSPWRFRRGDAEAQPGYLTTNWKQSVDPLPMGADGDDSAYAWYRTVMPAAKAGSYILNFSDAGDWLTVFVNGKRVGSSTVQQRLAHAVPRRIPVTLTAGRNTIAVLTAHYGRQKLFNFLGPIGLYDAKGLSGPVTLALHAGTERQVTNWCTHAAVSGNEQPAPIVNIVGNDWHAVNVGEDTFHGRRGFLWYRSTIDFLPGPHHVLHFDNVDDNATVWLNGKKLAHHEGWGQPFDVPLDSAWNGKGPNRVPWNSDGVNQVAVLVENTDGAGGIMGTVTLEVLPDNVGSLRAWKLRGGLGDTMSKPGIWDLCGDTNGTGIPTYYRSEFNWTPPAATGLYPILRVSVRELTRGFVWLNGHNLGRYPEKVPVDGLYLPECWLKPGKNTLIVFDEEGASPARVHLVAERAASRIVTAHTVQ